MKAPVRAALRGAVLATVLVPVAAGVALAHPLGNFTINHYAGIRVEPERVLLDVVIDEAEIPTFQASQAFDLDGDGALSAAETTAARQSGCLAVGRDLRLAVGGSAARLLLVEAGLAFPPGNGGLSTMRLACTFEAPLSTPVGAGTAVDFEDRFEASRIGWREITIAGSGVTVEAPGVPQTSVSGRLTAYPGGLAAAPSVRSVSFNASLGGATLAVLDVADAGPVGPIDVATGAARAAGSSGRADTVTPGPAGGAPGAAATASAATSVAVPGGEASIPDALRSAPATPLIALVALLTAAALGAGHALTPGHGKTLMAAYLVGTRGTPRHAVGLGLAVSVSHTLGILGLAAVVLAAESTLPPDLVVRVAPLVAAVSIVVIGGWMLMTEVRRGLAARRAHAPAGGHDHDHGHVHGHGHASDHGPDHQHHHEHGHDGGHAHEPGHAHDASHHDPGLASPADDGLEHSHGGVRHRHVPAAGSTISWRSLFVLGLAGGLVPSASALLILLATIAAGRPAWGVILVAAFGLGMAGVMTGVGLAFVHARGLLERAPARIRATRAVRLVPAGAAALVLAVGVVLTTQAISVVGRG
jgi:ABC-type nickel/cobalt efflux system permease component RcnA